MSATLTIEMLPARHGDALLVSYGPQLQYRMLIDAGPVAAWDEVRDLLGAGVPLSTRIDGRRVLDLLVITHVDTDHIEGVLKLLHNDPLNVEIGDIWFNDHAQLMGDNERGGAQGEYLSALLSGRTWNQAWDRGPVRLFDDDGTPVRKAAGDTNSESFTLLSPTREKARRMAKAWTAHCAKRNLQIGDVEQVLDALEADGRYRDVSSDDVGRLGRDGSAPNGSSIAFLFEVGGRSVIFTGDAHADVLAGSIGRVRAERRVARLKVDAFKLSHHGSQGNISQELLDQIECDTFLVSTNGDIFGHPDPETIKLIAASAAPGAKKTIWFNYRSETTATYETWANLDVHYGTNGHAQIQL